MVKPHPFIFKPVVYRSSQSEDTDLRELRAETNLCLTDAEYFEL